MLFCVKEEMLGVFPMKIPRFAFGCQLSLDFKASHHIVATRPCDLVGV